MTLTTTANDVNDTLVRTNRLRRLQGRLEALMSETRLLRQGLEVLISAHEFALRELSQARRKTRTVDLSRAHRLF